MATSSIFSEVVIKDEATLRRLIDVLENKENIPPLSTHVRTDEDDAKARELAKKWLKHFPFKN